MKFKAHVSFAESEADIQKKDVKNLLLQALRLLSEKDPNILKEAEDYIKGGYANASS